METNKTNLKGKTAVVTGASSGIGQACALALHNVGATVINLDIHPQTTGGPYHIPCDVSSHGQIATASSRIFSQWGTPDILISCAGVGIHEPLYKGDPEKWERAVQVNIMGTLRFVRAFSGQMLERQSGDAVFISSVAAQNPYTSGGVYSATKLAIERIAETLRIETSPHLRVIIIAPGLVETKFLNSELSGPRQINDWKGLSPHQIADAVLYALAAPAGTVVNQITLRPTGQLF